MYHTLSQSVRIHTPAISMLRLAFFPLFSIFRRVGSLSLSSYSFQNVSGGMYHNPAGPSLRRFSNFSSNLRSAENVPYKVPPPKKKYKTQKKDNVNSSVSRFPVCCVCVVIRNHQPYLILALHPPQSSCARHNVRDVGPVDRVCQRPAVDVNECMKRVGLPQCLNECRLDNMRDKSEASLRGRKTTESKSDREGYF